MAQYEIVIENQQRGNGWDYLFHRAASSADEALDAVFGDKGQEANNELIQALRDVHADATTINAVAARNLERNRSDVRRRTLNLAGLGGSAVNVEHADDDDPDVPSMSIEYRLYGASGGQRLLTISGVPDNFIARSAIGADVLQIGVRDRMNALVLEIADAQLQIQVRGVPVVGTATERKSIRRIEPVPNSESTRSRFVYARATELFTGGYEVQFTGISRTDILLAPYSGRFAVLDHGEVADSENEWYFDVQSQYIGQDPKIVPVLLRAQQVVPGYSLIEPVGDFVAFANRKRGPARVRRGRESGVSYRRRTL